MNFVTRYLLLFLLIVTAGCQRTDKYASFIRYHDDGRAKPVVALVPLLETADHQLPWSVSQELTQGIRDRLSGTGNLYLLPQQVSEQIVATHPDLDFTGDGIDFAKAFTPAEYVVVAELLEHDDVPYRKQQIRPIYPHDGLVPEVLMMLVRLRVVDVRGDKPRVVLSQLVHSNHMMPKRRKDVDYSEQGYGSKIYRSTPIGMAHTRLERDLATQVEQYIEYAHR